MRRSLLLTLLGPIAIALAGPALADEWRLDASFGGDGMVVTDVPAGGAEIHGVAVQADGKLVVCGEAAGRFLFLRYDPDGTLDPSFGSGGIVLGPGGGGRDVAIQRLEQSDYIVGLGTDAAETNFCFVRLDPDGNLDATFGGLGHVSYRTTTVVEDVRSEGARVVIGPDQMITAVGSTHRSTGNIVFAVIQVNSDGTLNQGRSFGYGGEYRYRGYDLVAETDGKITVAGEQISTTEEESAFYVVRRMPDLVHADLCFADYDPEVCDGGVVRVETNAYASAAAVIKTAAGGYYAAGRQGTYGPLLIVRLDGDGHYDPGFGDGGIVIDGITAGASEIHELDDGRILVSGDENFKVVRLDQDGSVDLSLNGTGYVDAVLDRPARDMVVQADGRIVVVGDNAGDVVIMRYREIVPWADATPPGLESDRRPGAGIYWADVDADGDLDFLLARQDSTNSLLTNLGGGVFAEGCQGLLDNAGTDLNRGATWGDMDNDGDEDLYLTVHLENQGPVNSLFRNDGSCAFPDIADPLIQDQERSRAAGWADLDNDGLLDLYVVDVGSNHLYRNLGGNVFADVTPAGAVNDSVGAGLAFCDFDGDGDTDIYVTNLGDASALLRNDGGLVFTDVAAAGGVDLGDRRSSGCAWGDYDNDGDFDLYVANDDNYGGSQANALFRNDGDGSFTEVTAAPLDDAGLGKGVAWADYDNDGFLDLYLCNGDGPNRLFRNLGDGTFEIAFADDPLVTRDGTSQGVSWADYDEDGDLDLALANGEGSVLVRNGLDNGNHWLQIDLVGTLSNRSAIGALVRIVAGGLEQLRQVDVSSGFLGHGPRRLAFGLGSATVVDSVVIRWPSGLRNALTGVTADQMLEITETVPVGVIDIAAVPEGIAAPWHLVGPTGLDLGGVGDSTLTSMPAGTYSLTWLELPGWLPPSPAETSQDLAEGGTVIFSGVYQQLAYLEVDVSPDGPAFGWRLTGPAGFDSSGAGDALLQTTQGGDYQLLWDDAPGWRTPAPNPETRTLALGDSVLFEGAYVQIGRVAVDPDPDHLAAPWRLLGPAGLDTSGHGDEILDDLEIGEYTLTWGDVDGWLAPSPNPQMQTLAMGDTATFAGLYEPEPLDLEIVSIADVGNDQGRNVRLVWSRSLHDAPDDPVVISGYEVYRRQDAYKSARLPDGATPRAVEKLLGWDSLAWLSAHYDSLYQYVAPTLCDSTAREGICWSVFRIRATTADPGLYFDSPPDSGYSVDNLAPAVPEGFLMDPGEVLVWSASPETDLGYYSVYGSAVDHLDGSAILIGQTTATSLDVHLHDHAYFLLTASDQAGNESGAAVVDVLTHVGQGAPTRFALHQCVPNPFNPATSIRFDLPEPSRVSLEIYDLSGRRLRTLVGGEMREAGRHECVWSGRDDAGRQVAAGVYFYRLRTGAFRAMRRMTLVK